MRDALGLLDKVLTFHSVLDTKDGVTADSVKDLLGLVGLNLVGDFVQLILEKKAGDAIDFLNKNLEEGMDPQEFTKNLIRYLRHTLVLKINPQLGTMFETEFTKEQLDRMRQQAENFDEKLLPRIVESFMEAEQKMKYSSIIQLPLELAIIESCLSRRSPEVVKADGIRE